MRGLGVAAYEFHWGDPIKSTGSKGIPEWYCGEGITVLKIGSFTRRKGLYFDAVEDDNTGIITTADAVIIVIEDSLFSVLK